MKAPALVLGAALALGCTEENNDPCYQNQGLCDDAGQSSPDGYISADGEFRPDMGMVGVDFGGDAMAVVDSGVDVGVKADQGVQADQGVEIDAGLSPDADVNSPDAMIDAAVEPDAAPVRPCSVRIASLESRGAVDRTMEVFCSEGPRQIGAHEGDIVFGNGNVCGVDGMPTAWGLMDAMHTVTLEALGDCGQVRVDVASRENLPTGEGPRIEGTQENFDQNGVLIIEADDYGAGADNDGDGDTDAQRGSAVVRLHRPQVN